MNSSPFEPEMLSEKLLGPSHDVEQPAYAGALPEMSPHGPASGNLYAPSTATGDVSVGTKQLEGFRDVGPALLFLVHLVVLLYLAVVWGVPSLHYRQPDDNLLTPSGSKLADTVYKHEYLTSALISFTGMLALTALSSLVAVATTAGTLWVLMQCLPQVIQAALTLAVAVNAALVVYFFTLPSYGGVALSTLLLVLAAVYARAVRRRVPLATAHLTVAVAALQANAGVALLAYGTVAVFGLYAYVFLLAWLGVYVPSATCHSSGYCDPHMGLAWGLFFVLSFYWTAHVIKNVLHVTVSGLVGTWYFCPQEASQFCSPAIMDSLSRACTWSFGSVCLGSLLTAVLQVAHTATQEVLRHQPQGSPSLLGCALECLVGFLDRLVRYCNKYAMVYVGLYGYDYLTAGRRAADLFAARGWTAIVNEDLVGHVLALLNVVIGAMTGAFGLYLASRHPSWTEEFGTAETLVAFGFPFFVGTGMSSVLLGVVASAVGTILVTFCETPLDFERNHPGLHRQMISAWRLVYPETLGSIPA